MTEQIVTMKVYESDRNWLERLKRKINAKNFQDTIKSVRRLVTKYKMEGELE